MTTKRYAARLPVRVLAPDGNANRVVATADGATMAMQEISPSMLAVGATLRGATKVVAASNASTQMRAQADYLCDGTADEVQINAALAALPASGGTVLLSEGTFTLAAPVATTATKQTLRGMGMEATTLRAVANGGAPINAVLVQMYHDDCGLADMTVDGNRLNQTPSVPNQYGAQASAARALIFRVRFANAGQFGLVVLATATGGVVRDCLAENVYGISMILRAPSATPLIVSGCTIKGGQSYGFYFDSGPVAVSSCAALSNASYGFYVATADVAMTHCVARSNSTHGFRTSGARTRFVGCQSIGNVGAGFETLGSQAQFTGCHASGTTGSGLGFRSTTGATDALYAGCSSSGNVVGFDHIATGKSTYVGCRALTNTNYGFSASAGEVSIRGCYVLGSSTSQQGIYLSGGTNHSVDGNRVQSNGLHGIRVLAGVNDVQVNRNYVRNSSLTTDGGSNHIALTGLAPSISANMLRDPAAGNRPPNGLSLGPGLTDAWLGYNDMFGAGTAGEVAIADVATNRRVAKLQLDYLPTIDFFNASLGTNTWTDIVSNQTFRVDSPRSLIVIYVRGVIRVGNAGVVFESAARLVIDSAGTPINKLLSGNICETGTQYQNVLAGAHPIRLKGLAAGNHTVKLQGFSWGTAGNARLWPSSFPTQEHFSLQVVEYAR